MPNIEAISVLAVIEAQDKATGILSGIFSRIKDITSSFAEAGAAATEAGKYFAGSQYASMSSAERLAAVEADVAAREAAVAAASAKVSEAQSIARAAYEDSALAASKVAAANEEVRVSQLLNSAAVKEASLVSKELATADGFTADVLKSKLKVAQDEVTASTERLMLAQRAAADAIEAEGIKTRDSADAARALRVAQNNGQVAATALRDAQTGLGIAQAEVNTKSQATTAATQAATTAMLGVGAATLAATGYSVDLAAKFQTQTQVLVAGANVQQNRLEDVRKSIMQTAQDTGTSTKSLSDSFFVVNSRLSDVDKSMVAVADAAQLAKVHNADLTTVSMALANAMNAYSGSGMDATQVSNLLGVAVERGGMSFQQLSTALSKVAPIAASAQISLQQVSGALSVMTGEGMSADQSSQDLAHTIEKLQTPTNAMISTWGQMGLSTKQVTDALHGPGGLQAAMDLISETAKSKLGPNGEVVIDTFKKSQDAAQALNAMLNKMDPSVKNLAQSLQNGSISVKEYNKAAMAMSGSQEAQAKQFEALYTKANGFNDALKAGKPGFSDFDALLKSAYGDATSFQTALMLSGDQSSKWSEITKEAGDAAKDTSGKIQGWSALQSTLNQKLAQAKEAASNAGIALGTAFLPVVTSLVQTVTPYIEMMAKFIEQHQTLSKVAVSVGLGLGAIALGFKAITVALGILNPILALFDAELDANPVGLVALAIAALVVGLIELYKHSALARQIMNQLGEYMKTGLKMAVEIGSAAVKLLHRVIQDVFGWFKDHHKELSDAWDKMMKVIHSIAKWFDDNVVKFIKSLISEFITWWDAHTKQIHEVWKFIWDMVKTSLKVAIDVIMAVLKTLLGFWDLVWGLFKDTVKIIWDTIMSVVHFAIHQVLDIITLVLDVLTGRWGKVWDDLGKMASDAWHDLTSWLGGLASGTLTLLEDAGRNVIKGLINGIKSMSSGVENTVSDIVSGIRSYLPFSPAKKGPLSGTGGLDYAGMTMGRMLSDGLHYSIPLVNSAAEKMAGAASIKAITSLGITSGAAPFNAYGNAALTGALASTMGFSTAPGLGGGGGASEVHIHLDQGALQGTVITDPRALDEFTQRLGYHIATKALPNAGVRLHY